MVYPNGRTIEYNYSGTNLNSALDNAIGRLDSVSDPDNGGSFADVGTGSANSGDSGQVLEQYSYLGLNTIVGISRPQAFVSLSLRGANGSIGSGGDSRRAGISASVLGEGCRLNSVGLDQFGRVVDQNWVNTSTGLSTDNFTYAYDQNSNVTAENNLLDSAYSQAFTYDQLNRLASDTRGGAAYQSWNLDSQGKGL